MSERDGVTLGGCVERLVYIALGVAAWLVLFWGIQDHYELRDLQRRVGQLEQRDAER